VGRGRSVSGLVTVGAATEGSRHSAGIAPVEGPPLRRPDGTSAHWSQDQQRLVNEVVCALGDHLVRPREWNGSRVEIVYCTTTREFKLSIVSGGDRRTVRLVEIVNYSGLEQFLRDWATSSRVPDPQDPKRFSR
jgi:hypothetical protein